MDPTDHELLKRYGRGGSEESFAELVRRHLDLVYSAARRQVGSGALAEDVTQSVFLDLAKAGRAFDPGTPVVAWLHLVTRRTAIDAMRRESRLKAREQIALEISSMNPPPSDWLQLEPLLDEALDALGEADRGALLLRYFENKSLREVGLAMGVSDDAAQKRVSRALGNLRAFFGKRGIAVGASGLLTSLSAHAVQSAPAALGTTISSAVASLASMTLQQALTVHVTKTLVMTTVQKTFVAVAAIAVLGGGFYKTYQFYRQESEVASLRSRVAELSARDLKWRQEREAAARKLAEVEHQIDAALARTASMQTGDAALAADMRAWLGRVDRLKELVKERPELTIPEHQFLQEENWFSVAKDAQLDTDDHIRAAVAKVRSSADNISANKLSQALKMYLAENAGVLPEDPRQLAPFFDPSVDPAFLENYEMLKTGKLENAGGRMVTVLAVKAPVDVEYDGYWKIGPSGDSVEAALSNDIREARKSFAKANAGQRETDLAQLVPYLKWPVQVDVLRKFLNPTGANASR